MNKSFFELFVVHIFILFGSRFVYEETESSCVFDIFGVNCKSVIDTYNN